MEDGGGGTAGWRRAWPACVRRRFEPRILEGTASTECWRTGSPVWGGAAVDCGVDRSIVEESGDCGFSGEWRFPSASPMRHSFCPQQCGHRRVFSD